VVMGAVEAARPAVHRLEQVDPPDRLADPDGRSRIDVSLQLAPVEDPKLEADTVLRPLLTWLGIGIQEVEIADNHTDLLEHESL
jgi:hypothetical protein